MSVHDTPDAYRSFNGSHITALNLGMAIVTAVAPDADTTVTGIKPNDHLMFVGHIGIDTGALETEGNLTSQFNITEADTIVQPAGAGVDTVTGDLLLVVWSKTHPNG